MAEAQQATLQADQAASEGAEDDDAHALRQAAAKWNKRYIRSLLQKNDVHENDPLTRS